MGASIQTGGKPKMPDSEAKKKWIAENTIVFSLKLMKKADADIIAYLDSKGAEGVKKGTVIKQALREYMTTHPAPSASSDEL